MRFQIVLLILTIFIAFFLLKLNYNPVVEQAHYGAGPVVEQDRYATNIAGKQISAISGSSSSLSNPLVFVGNSSDIVTDIVKKAPPKIFCHVEISAKAGLAKYLDSSENNFELNIDKVLSMASVSKLMTAVIATERMDLNSQIEIDNKAMAVDGDSNNLESGGFMLGEVFRANDLMKAMLMTSSNKAAAAIAENFDKKNPKRSEKEFVVLMNQKAKKLGMDNTYYDEETGLSVLNRSTAVDLSKLADYIYNRHPEILALTTPKQRQIFDLNNASAGMKILINIDDFAGLPNFIGGKTGYLDDTTGHNLAAIFKKNNRPVLTIILGAADIFEQTKKLLTCF